jgi:exopolysaccharide biosynthesis polyprenyl glycosylphosphotransferase
MAITAYSIWRWFRVENTEVDRSLPRELSVGVSIDGAPSKWRPGVGRKPSGKEGKISGRRLGGGWVQLSYALIDLFLVWLDALIAFSLRFLANWQKAISHWNWFSGDQSFPFTHYIAFLLLYSVLLLLFCQTQSLYRTIRARTATEESFAIVKAVFLATLLLSAFIYLSGVKTVSRLVVGYAGVFNVLTFIGWRLWKRRIIADRAARGIGMRNVLIVGAGRVGQALAQHLEENKLLGYRFIGFLDVNHGTDPRLLGKIEDLSRIARTEFADEVFITIPSERELVKTVAGEGRRHRLNVKVVPDLYDGFGWDRPITHIGHFPAMELHSEPIPAMGLFVKRLMDILGSGLGLILVSPLLTTIGVAIRLDSPGPVVYCSQRVGRRGRRFACYKFRTMVANADAVKEQLRYLNERQGPTFKITNDPRITRLGKLLRKYSLDELPQLYNVLKGDMSLVGPRPHPLDDYDQYSLEHLRRLDVKPGITGLWQIIARKQASFDTNMQLDVEYIERWNFWLDMKILLKTLPVLLSGSGV